MRVKYNPPPSMLIEGFDGAVCPVCRKVISEWETGTLLLCEHALALYLDLIDHHWVHPAYAGLHEDEEADSWTDDWCLERLSEGPDFGDLNSARLVAERDRFLIEEDWSVVQLELTGMAGPFGSTWSIWVAWPAALLDPALPDGGVQRTLDRVAEELAPTIGSGRIANGTPVELMPAGWRGEGVVLEP